jgi:hypothetical protein
MKKCKVRNGIAFERVAQLENLAMSIFHDMRKRQNFFAKSKEVTDKDPYPLDYPSHSFPVTGCG